MMRVIVSVGLILLASCLAAEGYVERGGYAFTTYRLNERSGHHVGALKFDADVDGFVCKGGNWAHFWPDWSLEACLLAEPHTLGTETIAAGTWVRPRPDSLIASFAADTPCQGYVCSGTGGAKGTQTVFYPSGQLKAFFPPQDVIIDGVLCKATPFANVQLHENGTLKRCIAAADGAVAGQRFDAGDAVGFD